MFVALPSSLDRQTKPKPRRKPIRLANQRERATPFPGGQPLLWHDAQVEATVARTFRAADASRRFETRAPCNRQWIGPLQPTGIPRLAEELPFPRPYRHAAEKVRRWGDMVELERTSKKAVLLRPKH
jgi:hypothetical protein